MIKKEKNVELTFDVVYDAMSNIISDIEGSCMSKKWIKSHKGDFHAFRKWLNEEEWTDHEICILAMLVKDGLFGEIDLTSLLKQIGGDIRTQVGFADAVNELAMENVVENIKPNTIHLCSCEKVLGFFNGKRNLKQRVCFNSLDEAIESTVMRATIFGSEAHTSFIARILRNKGNKRWLKKMYDDTMEYAKSKGLYENFLNVDATNAICLVLLATYREGFSFRLSFLHRILQDLRINPIPTIKLLNRSIINKKSIYSRLFYPCSNDGIASSEQFKANKSYGEHMLPLSNPKNIQRGPLSVTDSESIHEIELYYPSSVEKSVNELSKILSEDRFRMICESMESRGMRPGFTCLFYGPPGTGKTETVRQLCRMTGRDLMCVDVPAVRSMWVGESEKNAQSIFSNYRSILNEDFEKCPVLLLNEADSILGNRLESTRGAADKSENTLANVFLQGLEDFRGILIATTNMTGILDSAMDRRFMYKLDFERPDSSVRERIWSSVMPDLDTESVRTLAKFDLNGGEISNIRRKSYVRSLIDGTKEDDMDVLLSLVKSERVVERKVGFDM